MRMRSHEVRLNIWFLVRHFFYFHTSCVRTAKALARLAWAFAGSLCEKYMHHNLMSWLIWAPSSEFVSSSIPSWQILTAHAQPFRGARDLAFCLKVPLGSLLVWASSGGSGETARMRRLAWTFAACIGYKYQIRSICCWYSLESPHWGNSDECLQYISFYGELQMIIFQLSSNTHLICSLDFIQESG